MGRYALILVDLMPVLHGAVTFSRFRVEPAPESSFNPKKSLVPGLRAHAFEPLDRKGEDERSAGFVELEDTEASEFAVTHLFYGEYALFSWRVDTLKVPGTALKAELLKWESTFQKEQGRKPTRGERSQTRASLRQILRNRAVPNTRTYDLSWNLKTQQLQIWATSRKLLEEIQLALEDAQKVKLLPQVPAAMAARSGIEESALLPTAELVGMELSNAEVNHG